MKAKNKIITAILLSAGAAVGTALINKYIKMSAISRNLLAQPEPRCYRWRLGNIYYTKVGTGKPLLLVHDLTHASSSCEWDSLIPLLKEHYTVYTIDLLGCGRSEKPNLTYTNFLYVQLLNDFVKSEIGRRTNILATGASAPIVTMACGYNPDLFEQMMFINPDSLLSCSHMTTTEMQEQLIKAHTLGAKICIGTRGSEGSTCYDGDRFYTQAPHWKEHVVDTMGAGDAFISAFLYDFIGHDGYNAEDKSEIIKHALDFAAEYSANSCMVEGAFGHGVPYLSEE